MQNFDDAIAQIERASEGTLTADYRKWLRQHRPGPSDHRQTPFGVAELIETQRLVQDVIPRGTLAIGDDGYGNLVLLRLPMGQSSGGITSASPVTLRRKQSDPRLRNIST